MKYNLIHIFLLFTAFAYSQTAPGIEWQKNFGSSGQDQAYAMVHTIDGGYIMAGSTDTNDGDVSGWHIGFDTSPNPYEDFWVVKTDAAGNLQWQKAIGGSSVEVALSVIQTSDGGYAIAGFTASADGDISTNHGNSDMWVVKLNALGDLEWNKTYGGSYAEVGYSIVQTSDGGFAIAGITATNNDGDVTGFEGFYDIWLVRIDQTGALLWQKTIGDAGGEYGYALACAADGGFVITGYDDRYDEVPASDFLRHLIVVKTDDQGNLMWQKNYGGSGYDNAHAIITTSDGGYIIAGETSSQDGDVTGYHPNTGDPYSDYWILKLDAKGNLIWQKTLGGSGNDIAFAVAEVPGGYAIAGKTYYSTDGNVSGSIGNDDSWVVRLDMNGNLIWEKSFGSIYYEYNQSIVFTPDGGLALAGHSYANSFDGIPNNGNDDVWLLKLSPESLGTNEIEKNKRVVYPNPVSNVLYFGNVNSFVSTTRVYDKLGKLVLEHSGNISSLDMSSLASGFYILTLQSGQGVSSYKIIKE